MNQGEESRRYLDYIWTAPSEFGFVYRRRRSVPRAYRIQQCLSRLGSIRKM